MPVNAVVRAVEGAQMTSVTLSVGVNYVNDKVANWRVELAEGSGSLVDLLAYAELDPIIQHPLEKRQAARILALRMDPKVAIESAEKIRSVTHTK
jgi:hypothetical protein